MPEERMRIRHARCISGLPRPLACLRRAIPGVVVRRLASQRVQNSSLQCEGRFLRDGETMLDMDLRRPRPQVARIRQRRHDQRRERSRRVRLRRRAAPVRQRHRCSSNRGEWSPCAALPVRNSLRFRCRGTRRRHRSSLFRWSSRPSTPDRTLRIRRSIAAAYPRTNLTMTSRSAGRPARERPCCRPCPGC